MTDKNAFHLCPKIVNLPVELKTDSDNENNVVTVNTQAVGSTTGKVPVLLIHFSYFIYFFHS